MAEKSTNKETLLIAKDHVAPLITQFGMVRNELALLFDLPQLSAASTTAAIIWWQSQSAENQHTYREALAALASPFIIADIGINSGNESLVNTHAVIPSTRWNDPLFLLGEVSGAQFKLERLKQGDLLLNTLLLYLQGGETICELDMRFEISQCDFVVLISMTDLMVRLRYRSLLDHKPYGAAMKMDDIATSVEEGFAFPDPRWLLAFSIPILHTTLDKFPKDAIRQSVNNLVQTGLLQNAGGDNFSFTEAGERFVKSVGMRKNSIRIDAYGVGTDGRNGRQSQIFIRGESLLWYAGIGVRNTDTVFVAALDLANAEALLKEVFTPVAVPKPISSPAPAEAPAAADAPPKKLRFCPQCGTSIKQGKQFCPQCGTKVD